MNPELDSFFPLKGPCFICGCGIDARHRLLDAIYERYQAGDSIQDLALDYRLSSEAIRCAVNEWLPNVTA